MTLVFGAVMSEVVNVKSINEVVFLLVDRVTLSGLLFRSGRGRPSACLVTRVTSDVMLLRGL